MSTDGRLHSVRSFHQHAESWLDDTHLGLVNILLMNGERLWDWQNLAICSGAVLLILVTLEPDEEAINLWTLEFDAFYVFLIWFGVLALSAAIYLFRSTSDA